MKSSGDVSDPPIESMASDQKNAEDDSVTVDKSSGFTKQESTYDPEIPISEHKNEKRKDSDRSIVSDDHDLEVDSRTMCGEEKENEHILITNESMESVGVNP